MSAGAAPKQGDHVFNAIDTAIFRPFLTIRSLHSAEVNGQYFLHDYLLQTYSMAKTLAESPEIIEARRLTASAGAEEFALREIARLRSQFPSLSRVTLELLREIHQKNSNQFGEVALRFEVEVLRSIQQEIEKVLDIQTKSMSRLGRSPDPGMAYQEMLSRAYDPAAALILISDSAYHENSQTEQLFHRIIAEVAETLNRPGTWIDPYFGFRDQSRSNTNELVTSIGRGLMRLEQLKNRSIVFTKGIPHEIISGSRSARAQTDYRAMLHLLHTKLRQLRN